MTADEKNTRLAEITTGTDIETEKLDAFLALIRKLAVLCSKSNKATIGSANALCCKKNPSP